MQLKQTIALARTLLASAVGAFGVATIIASGSGGSSGGTDEQGNPIPADTWFKSFGGPNDDIAFSAVPTRGGGYAFAGMLNDNGRTGDLWLVKLDSLGDVQWQRAYGDRLLLEDGPWSLISVGVAPAQGPDGSIWFLGSGKLESEPGSRDDLVVAKLGADGNPAWAKSFDSGAHPDFQFHFPGDEARERGESVTPTADGGALVAAWSYVSVDVPDGSAAALRDLRYLWLLKLSASGSVLWTRSVTDDQFMYVKTTAYAYEEGERVVVRQLENGDLLLSIIARFADAWCPTCTIIEFTSTRFMHLRSGGTPVVNMRVPHVRISLPFEPNDRFSNWSLPAALMIDTDGNGTAEGYLLAGAGTDVGEFGVLGDITVDERAAVVLLTPDGAVFQQEFFDEWPDDSAFTTLDRLCLGTECSYLLSGYSAPADRCGRTPLLAEIDVDLDVSRTFTLVREDDPVQCFNWVPAQLEIEIPSDDPSSRDITLTGMGPPSGSSSLIPFGVLTVRLGPPRADLLAGTYVHTSLEAWERSITVTPDGQSLGVVYTGDPLHQYVLTRTSSSGEVTLSRALSAQDNERAAYDAGFALAQTADDGFIVIGETSSFDTAKSTSVWAVRTDSDGRLLWQRRLPGLVMEDGSVPNVLAVGDGFLFGAYMKRTLSPVVVKLDLTGDISWIARLPAGSCYDCDLRIATLANGDVIAVGTGWYGESHGPWLARVNSLGEIAWMRSYRFRDWSFSDIDVTPDGNLLVTGRRADIAAAWKFSSDGQPLWTRIYSVESLEVGLGVSPGAAGAPRADILADGGFLLGMTVSAESGEDNVLLLRADADGVAQWQRLIGARYREVLHELQALDDGGALLVGHSNSLGENDEGWIARLGPDGRIAAGCNAELDEFSQRLGTSMNVAPINLRALIAEIVELAPPDTSSLSTSGGEFIPTDSDVVVARQCRGTASTDNPGPPPAQFQLTVNYSSIPPGAITSSPLGITCGILDGTCSTHFDADAIVILRPDSFIIEQVARWEGCDSSESGFCIVRMTSDKSVRVVFSSDETARRLSITAIAGDGRIMDGAGLDCSSHTSGLQGTCIVSYTLGNEITLIAVPGAGQSLLSWGGDCTATADPTRARVVIDVNRVCSAVFSGAPSGSPTLQVNAEAFDSSGPVNPTTIGRIFSDPAGIDCGSDCSERLPDGAIVTLMAEVHPAVSADWEFERFVCPGIPPEQLHGRSATLQLTGDITCTARFRDSIERLYLDITDDGPGSPLGRVVSEPLRLECSADCDRPFETNQAVILRARPSGVATLRTWQGCDQTGPDPDPGVVPPLPGQPVPPVCYVTMSSTRTVAAFFEPISIGGDGDRTLTVAFAGAGSPGGFVNSTPAGISCSTEGGTCSRVFPTGTVVRLVAGTYPGTLFGSFVGCSRNNPDGDPATFDCEVDMVDDRFIQIQLLRP